MNRIIINNKSDLTDIDAIEMIGFVIEEGRVSNNNKQYCYLTAFGNNNKNYHVTTRLNKLGDSFTIKNNT